MINTKIDAVLCFIAFLVAVIIGLAKGVDTTAVSSAFFVGFIILMAITEAVKELKQ